MEQADLALADRVVTALGELADERGLAALSEAQGTVLLASWGKGLVDNGGFEYFYEGAANAVAVADAFERLGFDQAAQAFRTSLAAFAAQGPHADDQVRREWMQQHADSVRAVFEPLNSIIWDLDDRLESAIAGYVRAHPAEFGGSGE
jgi:hypothetical protein